jgi:hypothetical protein
VLPLQSCGRRYIRISTSSLRRFGNARVEQGRTRQVVFPRLCAAINSKHLSCFVQVKESPEYQEVQPIVSTRRQRRY